MSKLLKFASALPIVIALSGCAVSPFANFDSAPGTSRQALTIDNFNRIEPGVWTRNDVERDFGPPAFVEAVASWNGPILTYRWRDNQASDMFFWVYLDAQNIVRRAHPGMEFVNAPNERN